MTLIRRGLRHHWRLHASVAAGVAVATAALVGALLVGDSVSDSLGRFALQRLGRTEQALHLRNRYVASRLAAEVRDRAGCLIAPVLQLPGVAVAGEGDRQANQVQVLGVEGGFEDFGGLPPPPAGQADVNVKLARRLGLGAGDEFVMRIARPSLLPREAPLSSRRERPFVRVALTVRQVVPDSSLGRFGLAAEQTPPANVFVPLEWLQEKVGLAGRVNLLLAAARDGGSLATGQLDTALRASWQLADSGLSLRAGPEAGVMKLESDRVFLDPEIASLTGRVAGAAGSLTYLVNSLSASNGVYRMTPYSFVVATGPSDPSSGRGMADDEITVNQWLADHLAVKPGDWLSMAYYEMTLSGDLVERERSFRVKAVIGMEEALSGRELMPAFPGLTDVESCADWDIGMPMNETWLKDEANEAYWNAYRATPKAFITLAAGQEMWGNRYGNLTAIHLFASEAGGPGSAGLAARVDPAKLGLYFQPVRDEALRAVEEALDFGGLFLGMSFLVVVAALLLTALLFVLGVEQRAPQTGLLLALGYTPRTVSGLLLGEGLVVAITGAAAGAALGAGYARLLLWGLASLWPDAVAGAVVSYHGRPASLLTGAAAGVLCALGAMALALRRQARRPARELLAGGDAQAEAASGPGSRTGRVALVLALAATAGAIFIVAAALRGDGAVEAFFGAGALLLAAVFGYGRYALVRLAAFGEAGRLSVPSLALRNVGRRPGRSLAVAGLLAAGSFMVLAVASMQEDFSARASERTAGTGGFALYGQLTLGVTRDAIKAELGSKSVLEGVEIVPLKRFDGDDASCFNLNRARTPNLLGVDAGTLARLGAFAGPQTWALLDQPLADGAIPALAGDADTALWGLKRRAEGGAGDDIEYRDEQGRAFTVRLVGKLPMRLSVFQGAILVSERAFSGRFPSEEGYRALLVDAPGDRAGAVAERLTIAFERLGLDLEPATGRLAAFGSVQLAYLRMFLALGGLGLLIGSAGMGIVVLRNVFERREELAALRALGFDRAAVRRLVRIEHLLLLASGLAGGLASASAAMLPSLRSPGVQVPWAGLAGLTAALAILGTSWVLLAVAWAARGSLLEGLRDE